MRPDLSILIPTWNNLDCLQHCLKSLRANLFPNTEIVLHINDGSDGTLAWAREQHIPHTHTEKNVGICYAMNLARSKARGRYLMYLNDDMFVCPGLDRLLLARAKAFHDAGIEHFMVSGTLIEALDSGNDAAIVADYGSDWTDFREQDLLRDLARLAKPDWRGATWPPLLLPADTWDIVGGFSIEFSPGMYSDPDLSMKLWHIGCRHFLGVGDALVYHFASRSTKRIKHNHGRLQFLRKWGIASSTFTRHVLQRGQPWQGALPEAETNSAYRRRAVLDALKLRLR
ncbi:MAG: glycosyltransferase [Betaproteobacteria bacterium]|nr:glycosyltransferase [Betaproteobacteria bacterium]